jgi:hypothetical protein
MIPQITVHLLDSAQGHPLQTWKFDDRDSVTLGRSPDNDIVVTDPYVSRSHAYLKFDGDQWRLISLSRQQIYFEGQVLPEVPIDDGTVCRLGPHGCFLKFAQTAAQQDDRATISFDASTMPILKLDPERMQQEVSQFVEAPYFKQLKEAIRQRREQQQQEQQQLEETKR